MEKSQTVTDDDLNAISTPEADTYYSVPLYNFLRYDALSLLELDYLKEPANQALRAIDHGLKQCTGNSLYSSLFGIYQNPWKESVPILEDSGLLIKLAAQGLPGVGFFFMDRGAYEGIISFLSGTSLEHRTVESICSRVTKDLMTPAIQFILKIFNDALGIPTEHSFSISGIEDIPELTRGSREDEMMVDFYIQSTNYIIKNPGVSVLSLPAHWLRSLVFHKHDLRPFVLDKKNPSRNRDSLKVFWEPVLEYSSKEGHEQGLWILAPANPPVCTLILENSNGEYYPGTFVKNGTNGAVRRLKENSSQLSSRPYSNALRVYLGEIADSDPDTLIGEKGIVNMLNIEPGAPIPLFIGDCFLGWGAWERTGILNSIRLFPPEDEVSNLKKLSEVSFPWWTDTKSLFNQPIFTQIPVDKSVCESLWEEWDFSLLMEVLKEELPPVISVVMAHFPPHLVSRFIEELNSVNRRNVLYCLEHQGSVQPEMILLLERSLRKKAANLVSKKIDLGGGDFWDSVVSHLSSEIRRELEAEE